MKPILTLLSLAFCVTIYSQQSDSTLSTKQKDSIAKASQPIEGKAIVYIVRPTTYGAIIRMGLKCENILIGHTYSRQYVYTVLNPGLHKFSSRAESKIEIQLELEAGKIYFLKQQVQMGALFAETGLIQLTEEEGRKYLKKCSIAKDNVYSGISNRN